MTTTTLAILTALDAVVNGEAATLQLSGDVYPCDQVASALSEGDGSSEIADLVSPGVLRVQSAQLTRERRKAALGSLLHSLLSRAIEARGGAPEL